MATEPNGSTKEPIPGIDFVVSIIIFLLSIIVIVWSLHMPRPGGWSTAPGLMPLFLGATLLAMGIGLLVSAIRNNGIQRLRERMRRFSVREWVNEGTGRRTLWVVLVTGFYVFVLLGRIPFEIASIIYLGVMLYVFWRRGGWLKITLISVLLPLVFGIIFRGIFIILLPGGSVFDWVLK